MRTRYTNTKDTNHDTWNMRTRYTNTKDITNRDTWYDDTERYVSHRRNTDDIKRYTNDRRTTYDHRPMSRSRQVNMQQRDGRRSPPPHLNHVHVHKDMENNRTDVQSMDVDSLVTSLNSIEDHLNNVSKIKQVEYCPSCSIYIDTIDEEYDPEYPEYTNNKYGGCVCKIVDSIRRFDVMSDSSVNSQ